MVTKMLKLLIMRHCHAESGLAAQLNDRTRKLSSNGRAAADEIGQALFDQSIVPQIMLTSDAVRTFETAQLVCGALSVSESIIEPIAKLYLGSAEDYLEIIDLQPTDYTTALIIGHNPTVSTFFASCRIKGANTGVFKPGELAVMQIDISSWSQLRFHMATCTAIIAPAN